MTYRELYRRVCQRLEQAGCDSAAFDASCLLEQFGGMSRESFVLHRDDLVPDSAEKRVIDAAAKRAEGYPLQYILGEWDFLSLTLEVGEGVLIPRPDTELLCETATELLKGCSSPRVLDLCAGSGCVSLGIASLCPNAEVTAVELSDQALAYLKRNCTRYPSLNVTPVQADILRDSDRFRGPYDAVVSNPPYIPEKELPSLMREVRHEPRMALNGGDGLKFYRSILSSWTNKLRSGGFCAVEVGIGQASAVAAMMEAAGLRDVDIRRDYGEIERVVAGMAV